MGSDKKLLEAYYEGAKFQVDRLKKGEWKQFTSNFCREYARGRYGIGCSNTRSPELLRRLIWLHPELKPYIEIGTRKKDTARIQQRAPLQLGTNNADKN